ncbi:low specificity L-threonine aldolase [Bacillus tianshenii]|nr:low specificity L-threonine aldolase [Bacillus tianshenii]
MNQKSFASDNHSGIHPSIFEAIGAANADHAPAYGDDYYTKSAIKALKQHFGENIQAHFVFNGTGANVLGIKAVTRSFHAVLCAESAHIYEDECGAPEHFTGCKLLPMPTVDGKITVDEIKKHLHLKGDIHRSQPKVVSISQTTEMGTVYQPEEIKAIAEVAHENGLLVHMDGARLANAAASLNVSLKEITADAGVDVLSFGGTKNGLMLGETVIFFNKEHAADFPYIRKQGMQLGSKMRFIAAQFEAYLANDLWRKNAENANKMAKLLANKLEALPHVQLLYPVDANALFVTIPEVAISRIQEKYYIALWSKELSQVRLMTSFDTTEDDVSQFANDLEAILSE